MQAYKRSLFVGVAVAVMLWTVGITSCTNSTKGSDADPVASQTASGVSEPSKSFSAMLADVSSEVGQVTVTEGSGEHQICVLEERHTSIPGQFEIALMLLRLHDKYGLRDIALEGLTKDKRFPSIKWFRDMGGPEDEELKNQILVGMLREGEISAVELIAMAFPDVVVHAADDPTAYRVEFTTKAATGSIAYLYKIALKSVGPEHYSRLQQLDREKKHHELVEYVMSLDSWVKERYDQLNKDTSRSIEDTQHILQEIEKRAASTGAQISDAERTSMSEAKAFFGAAGTRTRTMVDTTREIGSRTPLIAMNVGAAHTDEIVRMLRGTKATFGVLKPLSLAQNSDAAELSFEAFERKNKSLSVSFSGKGLGSFLDGRRKPPPATGQQHIQSATQLRYIIAVMVRGSGGQDFPGSDLQTKINAVKEVKVNWNTVRKAPNGDVSFIASVLGEKGYTDLAIRAGRPNGIAAFERQRGKKLEQLLKEMHTEVSKEKGKRKEPEKAPVVEFVTPDVSAAIAKTPPALANVFISG
jgi:hypothetical protein